MPSKAFASGADTTELADLRQQLDASQRETLYWKWALMGLTGVYVFVYVMGRRRLMRKIWKRNRQLRTALDRADEANRVKTAFIRSVSHEIRTPLNAINGFSQLICSPDFNLSAEEKNDMRTRIMESTEAVSSIITELLEIAQGESQTIVRKNVVSPNDVCRSALKAAQLKNDKNLALSFSTKLKDSFTIKSNQDIVMQILEKLMDNALKFTDNGSVSMSCSRHGDTIEICIADTGIGIPSGKHHLVFENFVKLDDYRAGIGLGLPICRRLARALEGDIVLDSSYTAGSRFVLQLPV